MLQELTAGEDLRKKIGVSLGDAVAVKMSENSMVTKCKDLFDVITKPEIWEAL